MPARLPIFVLAGCLMFAPGSHAASRSAPAPREPALALVDTIAARHALVLSGAWDVLVPERVIDTPAEGVAVTLTLYALRDGDRINALLLTQRNVLPGQAGWGAPAACAQAKATSHVSLYQSPRDVLCGWARAVSFAPSADAARMATIAQIGLGSDAERFVTRADRWLWYGIRVSNRSDFLDVQLLLPDRSDLSVVGTEQFLSDMAHSIDATWLSGTLAAVPPPPKPAAAAPEPEPAGYRWGGTLSLSAMKTVTYRIAVTVKTFLIASLMAGNAATGGAIITVLNFTSTSIYMANDYLWETWNPLTPAPQDFVRLVDAK